MSTWKPIDQAKPGIGPLLLRAGAGSLDPVFIGHQDDDGRWFCGDHEAHPTHFAEIPQFDAAEEVVS